MDHLVLDKQYIQTPLNGRNSAGAFNRTTSVGIITNAVNDVAMTVLSNAPIDSATGLPVPTIAVASNGGVSVIMNDGTIKSDSALGLNNNATQITFQPNTSNIFFFVNGNHHCWADVNATTLNAAEISSNPSTGNPAYWSYWTGNDTSVHTDEHRIRCSQCWGYLLQETLMSICQLHRSTRSISRLCNILLQHRLDGRRH